MGVDIYAGKAEDFEGRPCFGPVVPFDKWNTEILAEDCDERADAGLDPFIPNPNYEPDAGMNMSCYNADMLFGLIGLPLEDGYGHFDIDTAFQAATRALNSDATSYTEDYHEEQRTQTSTVIPFGNAADAVTTEVATGPRVISFGVPEGYVAQRLEQLLRLIVKGRGLGATHLCIS